MAVKLDEANLLSSSEHPQSGTPVISMSVNPCCTSIRSCLEILLCEVCVGEGSLDGAGCGSAAPDARGGALLGVSQAKHARMANPITEFLSFVVICHDTTLTSWSKPNIENFKP